MSNFELLSDYIAGIRMIDTHEHLPEESERIAVPADPLVEFMRHYASVDAVVAGIEPAVMEEIRTDNGRPLRERWQLLKPAWPFIRTTGYGRVLLYAMRDLYGIDDLSDETIEPLAERMQAQNAEGLYRWVLCESGGIDLCLRPVSCETPPPEPPLLNVMNIDHLVVLNSLSALEDLGRATGIAIHRLPDLEAAVHQRLCDYRDSGIAGLKVGLAYIRPLRFEHVTAHEAESALTLLFRAPRRPWNDDYRQSMGELHVLQDYLMHRIVQSAEELALPIQIHTGWQEGYGNTVANSNPTLLTNLFIEYPRVKFILFHLSYPYTDELAVIAKTFQNVYVDFCWNHAAQPSMARRVLGEMVDSIPSNKLLGFGGDYCFVEGSYGHQLLARKNVAAALAGKIDEGYFSVAEAEFIARRLLRENALDLFKLHPALPQTAQPAEA